MTLSLLQMTELVMTNIMTLIQRKLKMKLAERPMKTLEWDSKDQRMVHGKIQ